MNYTLLNKQHVDAAHYRLIQSPCNTYTIQRFLNKLRQLISAHTSRTWQHQNCNTPTALNICRTSCETQRFLTVHCLSLYVSPSNDGGCCLKKASTSKYFLKSLHGKSSGDCLIMSTSPTCNHFKKRVYVLCWAGPAMPAMPAMP